MTDVGQTLRYLGEPYTRADKIKFVIERAARRAGLNYWRAYDIWYGRARKITEEETKRISTASDKKREEETRNELHDLRIRLTRMESLLVQTDPNFHRPSADYVREQIRQMDGKSGAANRAVDRKR